MGRFAGFRSSMIAVAVLAAACAKEPGERQDAVNDAAAPPPPLTTEMVGGTDAQPPVAPTAAPADSAPTTTPQATPTAPAAAPAAPDTGHADSAHTDH
ncbi:MAG TPA: hypothetical protein VFR37_03925 [Longimicrobium sp.]|nr:hypothetical protein [Longimicrobium sp.]